jgi:hypothetical protein
LTCLFFFFFFVLIDFVFVFVFVFYFYWVAANFIYPEPGLEIPIERSIIRIIACTILPMVKGGKGRRGIVMLCCVGLDWIEKKSNDNDDDDDDDDVYTVLLYILYLGVCVYVCVSEKDIAYSM